FTCRVRPPSSTLFPYTTLFRSVADRKAHQLVLFEHLPLALTVAAVLERLADLEMIAPACQLDPVVAEFLGLLAHRIELEVCPLSDRKSTGLNSSHVKISYAVFC